MARVGIVFGLLLCGLSALGMCATVNKNPIQFVPLMLGIPILFCGVVGLNPHRRRIAMNTACVVALLGMITGIANAIIWTAADAGNKPIAWRLNTGITVLCGIVFIVGVIAFQRDRKRRQALSLAGLVDGAKSIPTSLSRVDLASRDSLSAERPSHAAGRSDPSNSVTSRRS
ncbi:hypothetical protein K227x_44940 [Rubripirellula lacrimiformis]|uniref:Uncharacterized protein n=1 Tax=Rubripirellula lacrimiformis TaxID=1930273 RepID=A0A517NG19_9BACT|nr:hypothetical protein [Rubripirellula lacrimiformis]QDT06087.1 hypothetical protein K227x_44940 [Rubripirellula lacrimiformis]